MPVIFLPLILFACDTSQAEDNSEEEAARLSHSEATVTEVGTTPVKKGQFAMELVSNGQIQARQKAVVPFRVQELIESTSTTDKTQGSKKQTRKQSMIGRIQ